MILLTILSVCVGVIGVQSEYTTSRTYSMEIPELEPITIIEGDPLWDNKRPTRKFMHHFEDYTTSTISTNVNDPINDSDDTINEFSATALKDFLEKYAAKIKKDKVQKNTTAYPIAEEEEKMKNGLVNVKQYNAPYDDKAGWVSLEPIPWSVSQVSKWHSKPVTPGYHQQPDDNNFDSLIGNYGISSTVKPRPYKYNNKHKLEVYDNSQLTHQPYKKPSTYRRPENTPYKNFLIKDNSDIITDGSAQNFPKNQLDFNRRQGTELYPEPTPFIGDGNWVLLSTSKGYKYPKKQRSMKLTPEYINAHKSVQLTVLPPLKDSKINMTTSHGGLLQVESTFEPVEQAQKKFKKMQKIKNKRKRLNMKKKKKMQSVQTVHKVIPRSTSDSGAVIAGVGAGLIPATMAMMVPLVMNGKKRRRRDLFDLNSRFVSK